MCAHYFVDSGDLEDFGPVVFVSLIGKFFHVKLLVFFNLLEYFVLLLLLPNRFTQRGRDISFTYLWWIWVVQIILGAFSQQSGIRAWFFLLSNILC